MKKLLAIVLVLILALSFTACGEKKEGEKELRVIKLGIVGAMEDQWQHVKEELVAEGIDLQLVKYTEYSIPNRALADGDIDLNSFQHYAYLNKEVSANNYDLTVIGDTIIAPIGIYSKKIKNVSEIKAKDKIAIPSDATNGGRALKLLESARLIKVDPAVGFNPTLADITENKLNLEIIEIEAALAPSLLPDVAAAIINGGHAIDNGLNPTTDAIFLEQASEESDNPFINVLVARTAEKDDPDFKKVVEHYQTDKTKQVIADVYKGAYIVAW